MAFCNFYERGEDKCCSAQGSKIRVGPYLFIAFVDNGLGWIIEKCECVKWKDNSNLTVFNDYLWNPCLV